MTAAGVGPEVEYKGTVYHFQPVRIKEIGRFEAWLERGAWEKVFRAESWMPAAKSRELREETREDIDGQKLRFGSRRFASAQLSTAGLKEIALISLKAGEGNSAEIDGELIESLFENKPAEMASVLVAIGWLRAPEKKVDADKATGGSGS